MQDWAKLTQQVTHALTLDENTLGEFMQSLDDQDDAQSIKELLARVQPKAGFLATSSPSESEQETLASLANGTRVSSWQIDELIGSGGMGEVYKAHRADGLYEQVVAIKLIQGMSSKRAEQFEAERQRLALMDHPGIARIIDGGTSNDDRPFMVMEFVDGLPIVAYAKTSSLSQSEALRLFCDVCLAVEHAHSKLVLHRDIKSDNVLIDKQGNARLIDFGIASSLDSSASDGVALSIATAAPEQLMGESVSVQTDVFLLAVLLHELVTGDKPERLPSAGMQVAEQHIDSSDLRAILLRAMHFQPQQRYPSVTALREDVTALLNKQPVNAFNGGMLYRSKKFIQRFPFASALAAMVVVSLTAGLATSLKFASDAEKEAIQANAARIEAENSLARAEYFLTKANVNSDMQSAYADSLHAMFGGEADVERQTKVLMQRWQQAYDLREQDPRNAAFLSFAIGRHFLFRNDYPTAISIFQPWIEEGYGPKELLVTGNQLLAIAYLQTGQGKKALPFLRKVENAFASSFDAKSPDHIASATQIANVTMEEEDILKAEELLLHGINKGSSDPTIMYFWNQLSTMRQMRLDYDGSYQAIKEVVKIIDSKPLMEISGTDTGLLNLARLEYFHIQDYDRAEELAKRVVDIANNKKGRSMSLAIAKSFLARIDIANGKYQQALETVDEASQTAIRFSGETSGVTLRMKMLRAEIMARLGKNQAIAEIKDIRALLEDKNPNSSNLDLAKLTEIQVIYFLIGKPEAREAFASTTFNLYKIRRNIQINRIYEDLQESLQASD